MDIWCVGTAAGMVPEVHKHKGVRLNEEDFGSEGIVWELSESREYENLRRGTYRYTYSYPELRCSREAQYLAALQGLHHVALSDWYAVTSLEWSRRPPGLVVADRYIWLMIFSHSHRRVMDPVVRFVENETGTPVQSFLDVMGHPCRDAQVWQCYFEEQIKNRHSRWRDMRRRGR